jgi:hypothetical protein
VNRPTKTEVCEVPPRVANTCWIGPKPEDVCAFYHHQCPHWALSKCKNGLVAFRLIDAKRGEGMEGGG